jgi:hypothetical protein
MSIEEKVPMSRTSITIVVVVLLCAAGFVYSQGWLNWSSSGYELESGKVSTDQTIDQEETKVDAARVTQQTKEPAATLTE